MPALVLADVIGDAVDLITVVGPYLLTGIGVALFPRLARFGKSLITR